MTDMSTAVERLAKAAAETSVATAFGGTTRSLGPVTEALAEALQDVQVELEEEDAPLLYLGWADTMPTIPESPEGLT